MNKNTDLVNDVIAEMDNIKKQASENIYAVLVEKFEPAVRNIISNKLAEDELEDEDYDLGFEDEMDPLDVPAPDPIPAEGEPAEPATAEPAVDPTPAFTPEEEEEEDEFAFEDIDLDEIMQELDEEEELDEDSDTIEEGEDYIDDGDDGTPAGSNIDEAADEFDLDEILAEIDGEYEEEEVEEEPAEEDMYEVSRLRKEVKRLKEQNTSQQQAILHMKETLQNMNLMNAKLMHSVKIIDNNPNLTTEQKADFLRTLDKAETAREANLIAETFVANLKEKQNVKKTKRKPNKTRRRNSLKENASAASKTLAKNQNAPIVDIDLNRWRKFANLPKK